jgi:alpha-tubulin suppressor-like RCC1 family protein
MRDSSLSPNVGPARGDGATAGGAVRDGNRTAGYHFPTFVTPLLGVMLLCECTGGSSEPPPPPAPVASVEVGPASASLPTGSGVVLYATPRDDSGNALERPVAWASSDPLVAPVSPEGRVRAVAEGTTTITATSETKSGTATITVWGLVFRSVSAGYDYACGVTTTGLDTCWGEDVSGARGDGIDNGWGAIPTLVSGGVRFASLSAGGWAGTSFYSAHTCGVTAGGAAYCWGSNYFGELGTGTTAGPEYCYVPQGPGAWPYSCALSPASVAGGLSFVAVSTGYHHSCGVTPQGEAYCWGHNVEGAIGDGTTSDRDSPTLVAGGVNFAAVSAGGDFSCGVTATGSAYCWGLNAEGELAWGSTTGPETCQEDGRLSSYDPVSCGTVPVAVQGGLSFAAVSAGRSHACGVTAQGDAYCWGRNVEGELGDGTTTDRSSPTPVAGGIHFAAVSAGSDYTCGVTSTGATYCWGLNNAGQLGNGTTSGPDTCAEPGYTVACSSVPVAVQGGIRFAAVSAGTFQSCGVTFAGIVYCWGGPVSEYLAGSWATENRDTPTRLGP